MEQNALQARLAGLAPAAIEHLRGCDQALRRGDRARALQHARAAMQLSPAHPECLRQLAAALSAHGPSVEALAAIARAVQQRPQDPDLHATQAIVLEANGRRDEAIEAFRRASMLAPQWANHVYNLGRALSHRGDNADSLAALEHALALDPKHRHARASLAEVLRRLGRTEDAIAQFRHLLQDHPGDIKAWAALAALARAGLDDADIAALERLQSTPLGDDEQVRLGFALGKAYAGRGRYAQAYAAYAQANARVRARVPWNGAAFARGVDELLQAFAAPPAPAPGALGSEMIFIVSLPRSGSTLTEQILAAHPEVDGGDERIDLFEVIAAESQRRGQPLAQWAAAATPADWQRLGEDYLSRSVRWRSGAPRATDKLPGNWLWLGALFAMLPGARVIDCRRDRIETAWSCFCHLFNIGTQDFSFDFAAIAAYARDYDRAMGQWQQQYPKRIRTQRYEALLAEAEAETRALLAFCGLEFDPACLDFHAAQRSVRTASASQVREPLRRDTARTAHYGALLDPLRDALGLPPFRSA